MVRRRTPLEHRPEPLPPGRPRRKDVVRRSKNLIAVIVITLAATALAAASLPQPAEAASLKSRLDHARKALRESSKRLKAAEAALAATLSITDLPTAEPAPDTQPGATPASTATPGPSAVPASAASPGSTAAPAIPTVEELRARVAKARRAVRTWRQRVRRLAGKYRFQVKMAEWERRAKWMPIIEVAAARYHVKADGMYRMMMRESGGRRFAGAGSPYKGLYQYWTGTWSAGWNPYRHDSIYDGSSQIFATAYAISKGMGPQMWTTTFASQY